MVKYTCRSMNHESLPKNTGGFRTTHTCELCGFEPRTKNKYREKQDHLVMKHFKEKIDKIFPHCRPYSCPNEECQFTGKDKQALLRHYTGKHGILEQFLREALAEKGIEYLEDHPKRKSSTESRNGKKSPQTLGISTDIPTELLPTSPVPIATSTASTTPPTQNNEELRQEVESLMACLQPQPVQIQNNTIMQVNLPQEPEPMTNGNLNTRLTSMTNGIMNGSPQINGGKMSINGQRMPSSNPNLRNIVTMAESNMRNGVVNICNGQPFTITNNGQIPQILADKIISTSNGTNGHILNVGNGIPTTISLPTMPISKVNTMIDPTTLNLPMNPLPPMSVALPKEPNVINATTSNINERLEINVPQLISANINTNGSSNIPTIISQSNGSNGTVSSSNGILGSQTVNLLRRTPPNSNLPISCSFTSNSSTVKSFNMTPNNTSDAPSALKMSKLQSILSTSLPSRGIPTVINMSNGQQSPPLPPLQSHQQISMPNKASSNIPLPMDVVSKLTCSLPTSVSNGNSAINGVNGMILTQQQHEAHQMPSSNMKTNLLTSTVDIAAEAAAEVMEQSAKNVLENEEVMWGAPHGGPAVVVEIADTVPVTYVEANGEVMETKYEMSINGVGGNGSIQNVTALDHMDYDYLCSVTQNNDHQIHQRQLDFCML